MKRLPWLALALAAAAVLVSGCGSSSTASSQTNSTPAATSSTSTTASTPAATASTSTTGTTAKTSTGATRAAIAPFIMRSCKTRIQAEAALTSSEKKQVERLCNKVAEGGAAARAAAREICTEIVKLSAAPGSPVTHAREEALAACQKTGK